MHERIRTEIRNRSASPAPKPLERPGLSAAAVTHCLMSVTRQGGSRVNWKISTLRSLTSSVFVHSQYCKGWRSSRCYKEKARIAAGFFVLPASVSASAEAEGYTRAAITITAIVRPRSVAVASIIPRSVTVASIIRSVVTIAVMVVTTPVSMARTDVG